MVGFIPVAEYEYAKSPETVESVRVSGDSGSSGSGTMPDDSPKAARGEVGTIGASPLTSLAGCTLLGWAGGIGATGTGATGAGAIGILTAVTYCLAIVESAASTESSRLLLLLSPGDDVEGAVGSTLLRASMRRLLRVSGSLVLLACCTPEGVSSIGVGLGGTLLI